MEILPIKNWSFNLLFQGATNYSVFNSEQFVMPFGDNMTPYAFWEKRWTEDNPNPNAELPRSRFSK